MHRKTVNSEFTKGEETSQDERMSKLHSLFQGATLLIVIISFAAFSKGAFDGIQAIRTVTIPIAISGDCAD